MGNAVVHFDITGPQPEELETFYGELFGWRVTPIPDMHYALVDTQGGGGVNGGIGAALEGPGLVTFYVEVDDLQATLDKAASLGGTTVQEPMVIPGVVALAMLADPEGHWVGLTANPPGEQPQPQPSPSEGDGAAVSWFEVIGNDGAALVSFYSDLFGWGSNKYDIPGPVDYWEMQTGADHGIQGGIGNAPMGAGHTTVYAEVDDLQACLDMAEGLGAKTILPPAQMAGGPSIAIMADPQGHVFGIYHRRSA